jgi:hypothetical protein
MAATQRPRTYEERGEGSVLDQTIFDRVSISLVLLALGACSRASGLRRPASDALPAPPASTPSAAPTPPSATQDVPLPPYDLLADVKTRSAAADAEFHAPVTSSIERHVFLLLDADRGGRFEATLSLVRRTSAAHFAGPFAKGPDRAVSVHVSSTTDE